MDSLAREILEDLLDRRSVRPDLIHAPALEHVALHPIPHAATVRMGNSTYASPASVDATRNRPIGEFDPAMCTVSIAPPQ